MINNLSSSFIAAVYSPLVVSSLADQYKLIILLIPFSLIMSSLALSSVFILMHLSMPISISKHLIH